MVSLWVLGVSCVGLTLSEAVDRAKAFAPEVAVAEAQVSEAEATRVGAAVPLPTNPRVYANYRGWSTSPDDPDHGYLLGVTGELEVNGAWGARLTEAARRVAVAKANLAQARARAARAAFRAYVDAAVAEDKLTLIDQAVALQAQLAAAVETQLALGVSAAPDVALVDIALAELEAERRAAAIDLERDRFELRVLLGLPRGADIELTTKNWSELPKPDPFERLLTRAIERRSDLESARARIAVLQAVDSRLWRDGFVPRVALEGGVDAAPSSPAFTFLGIALSIPIAQFNQGPRAVAKAQAQVEAVQLEREVERVGHQLEYALFALAKNTEQLAIIDTQAVPNARRNRELVEEGWRSGRYDLFRLNQANRELVRIELRRLEMLREVNFSYGDLQFYSGDFE